MFCAGLGIGLQRGHITDVVNQYMCLWDQGLWKSTRATSQLLCVSVTPQNVICTSWSSTDHRPEVYVCHMVWAAAKEELCRAPFTRCFMESINRSRSRWTVQMFLQETPKEAEHLDWSFTDTSRQLWSRAAEASGTDSACTHQLTSIISVGLLHAPLKLL